VVVKEFSVMTHQQGASIVQWAITESLVEPTVWTDYITDPPVPGVSTHTIASGAGTVTLYAWARDSAGNVGVRSDAIEYDPSVISLVGPPTASAGATTAAITFQTDRPCNARVRYSTGLPPTYASKTGWGAISPSHRLNLSGLQPGTTYDFVVDVGGQVDAAFGQFTTVQSLGLKVLVVTSATPPSAAETAVISHLQDRGFIVDTVLSTAAPPTDYEANYHLLFCTSDVSSSNMDKYRDTYLPFITSQGACYGRWNWVNPATSGQSTATSATLTIVDSAHPMAAGLSGTASVFGSAQPMHYANPGTLGAAAQVIASVPQGPTTS
jgi:hypothetical protein